MKFFRVLFVIILLVGKIIFAFSNLGTDFFFCYPANSPRTTYFPPKPASFYNGMLILTSTFATTGTVHNSTGTYNVPFNIAPNSVTTIIIDSTRWVRPTETIQDRGLRIECNNPISAYFLSYEQPGATNDMALLFPVPSLGTEYIVFAWRDNAATVDIGYLNLGPSMFCIVATENNTSVTITPSAPTEGGHSAGVPFNVTLNAYQTYQVLACSPSAVNLYDLTGSIISSDKPIAVFSGSQIAEVPDAIEAADYLLEQIPPVTAWGTEFVCFPIRQRNSWGKDVLRILASEDGTNIAITDAGGTINVNLNRGQYWEWNGQPCYPANILFPAYCDNPLLDSPTHITSDKPVLVGQYIMGAQMVMNWLGTNPLGDPAFMQVPPIEQYSKRYIFLTPSGYNNDFLNVAIPSGYEATVTIDGGAPTYATPWFAIPGTTYRGARISVSPGSHILEADTTMLLQIYGYDATYASYAAIGGQNLNPINAEFIVRKYCLETPVMTGTQTTWRIVIYQQNGDPSTGVTAVDTLPPGFSYSGDPIIVQLYGSATRTSVVNPSAGATILTFGEFSMHEGDSVVIIFTANIQFGVQGLFNNPIFISDDSSNTASNQGGTIGPEDDCLVIVCDTLHAQTICPNCGSTTSCIGQVMTFIIWDISGTIIDTNRVYFTVNNGIGSIFPIVEATHHSNIMFTCFGACDSLSVTISGFNWTDGANVVISLDSAFTADGCKTIFHP